MATSGLFVTPRYASAAVEPIALAVVVAAAALVDPRGNFPLNDDWDFAYVTWDLAEQPGIFRNAVRSRANASADREGADA